MPLQYCFLTAPPLASTLNLGGLGASRLVCAEQNLSLLPGCTKQGKGARHGLGSKSAKEHGLLVELGKGLCDDSKLDFRGEVALGVDVEDALRMLHNWPLPNSHQV